MNGAKKNRFSSRPDWSSWHKKFRYRDLPSSLPKNSRSSSDGARIDATESSEAKEKVERWTSDRREASGRSESKAMEATSMASATDNAKTEGQSTEGQHGTKPSVLNVPQVGFRPTTLFKEAGIRPDPPVSVPMEKQT